MRVESKSVAGRQHNQTGMMQLTRLFLEPAELRQLIKTLTQLEAAPVPQGADFAAMKIEQPPVVLEFVRMSAVTLVTTPTNGVRS